MPARELFHPSNDLVHRLHAVECADIRRERAQAFAVHVVAGAHADLIELVEHIQFGDDEAVDAVDACGVLHRDGVVPAAAPRASGRGAELMAEFPEPFAVRRR